MLPYQAVRRIARTCSGGSARPLNDEAREEYRKTGSSAAEQQIG
jgi:hypothetical protein